MKTIVRMRREFQSWAKSIEIDPLRRDYNSDGTELAWLAWREQERRIAALIAAVRGELDREDGDS